MYFLYVQVLFVGVFLDNIWLGNPVYLANRTVLSEKYSAIVGFFRETGKTV